MFRLPLPLPARNRLNPIVGLTLGERTKQNSLTRVDTESGQPGKIIFHGFSNGPFYHIAILAFFDNRILGLILLYFVE